MRRVLPAIALIVLCTNLEAQGVVESPAEKPGKTARAADLDRQLLKVKDHIVKKRAAIESIRMKQKRLEKVKLEDHPELLVALGIQNETVSGTARAMKAGGAKEAELRSSGLGNDHPQIQALQKAEAEYQAALKEDLEATQNGLNTQLSVEQAQLDALEKNRQALEKASDSAKTPAGIVPRR